MKPLTGLPVDSLVRVSKEVGIPLKDLLELVQQVENGASAAFLARYRADLCAGVDEDGVQRVLQKLADARDLIDRRISMMASLGQRGVMSDELREQLEQATSRRELNDLFMRTESGSQERRKRRLRRVLTRWRGCCGSNKRARISMPKLPSMSRRITTWKAIPTCWRAHMPSPPSG